MYRIIGADGREYGPVNLGQFREWLAQGRVNAQTRVRVENATEWRTVVEIPELAACLPGASPPPPLSVAPTPVAICNLVQGPAIFLLILCVLDIFAALLGIFGTAFQIALPALLEQHSRGDAQFQRGITFAVSLPGYVLGLCITIFCLIGAIQMMKLRNYGMAMASAILIMVPCGTCCCLLNIGAGIWGLVVLSRPEVRDAFQ